MYLLQRLHNINCEELAEGLPKAQIMVTAEFSPAPSSPQKSDDIKNQSQFPDVNIKLFPH